MQHLAPFLLRCPKDKQGLIVYSLSQIFMGKHACIPDVLNAGVCMLMSAWLYMYTCMEGQIILQCNITWDVEQYICQGPIRNLAHFDAGRQDGLEAGRPAFKEAGPICDWWKVMALF